MQKHTKIINFDQAKKVWNTMGMTLGETYLHPKALTKAPGIVPHAFGTFHVSSKAPGT